MPFTRSVEVGEYVPSPPPALPGSERAHYDRELRLLSAAINQMVTAIRELQDYVETLEPPAPPP